MSVKVTKLASPPKIDANWDKSPWQSIQPELIGKYMGQKPEHIPGTQVKIAYDDTAVYVIFRVEDRYVRAAATSHQGNVCRDSCVEFFFSPGADAPGPYFNIEMNCGGTMLFHFQQAPGEGRIEIPESDRSQIETAHSLPRIVDPEIEKPVTWTIEYRLPITILEKYCHVTRPAPGVTWRANFYKCADQTSHPHWLTWSSVDSPAPDFHLPQFFGVLEFVGKDHDTE